MELSKGFPLKKITTELEWEDLILSNSVFKQLEDIRIWLQNSSTIMDDWQLIKLIKPGYRALFTGPSGTGKTLTVALLGKMFSREVYKIDLSFLISNYIGETEKNLSEIFDTAERKSWILLFDEADALFGKRTDVKSANDRHANQQTSYLLQRIENFSGTIILTSNFKSNIDDAFTRRFQSIVNFPIPSVTERYRLWKLIFSGTCSLSLEVDLRKVAKDYELTGGNIVNILRFCAISAANRDSTIVTQQELLTGIRKELKHIKKQ